MDSKFLAYLTSKMKCGLPVRIVERDENVVVISF